MRAFIAVELSEPIKSVLLHAQSTLRRRFESGIRFVDQAQLHLTLKFLGDLDEECLDVLAEQLRQCLLESSSFSLELSRCGCFPPRGPVRVVWAGLDGDTQELTTLARRIDESLAEIGIEREKRPFQPHITLARVKNTPPGDSLRSAVSQLPIESARERVNCISLMESTLSSRGASYRTILSCELNA